MGVYVFVIISILIYILKPFQGLSINAHGILAFILVSLSLWIFKPGNMPYTAGAMLLLFGCLVNKLPLSIATNGFAAGSFWTLLPALFFGYAIQKTGLGNRIAYFVIKFFKPTYKNIIISWFIIGIILSLMTPSSTVRIAIMMPIAVGILDICRLKSKTKGASLILIIAFASAIIPGNVWINGSLNGPILTGYLPDEVKNLANHGSWFKIMGFPLIFLTVLFFIVLYIMFKPSEEINLTKEELKQKYIELGKISRDEKFTGIILLVSLIGLTTDSIHHLGAVPIVSFSLLLLIIFQIFNVKDISIGINWDIAMFFGSVISLQKIFSECEITQWLTPKISPLFTSLATNGLVFVIGVLIIFWIIRFLDVPWGFSSSALLLTFSPSLYANYNINPLILIAIFIIGGLCFFLPYQQPFIVAAEGIMGSNSWEEKYLKTAGIVFGIVSIITLILSYFYWNFIGAI